VSDCVVGVSLKQQPTAIIVETDAKITSSSAVLSK